MDKKTLPLVILLVIVIIFYYPILQFLGIIEEGQPQKPATEQTTDAPAADTSEKTDRLDAAIADSRQQQIDTLGAASGAIPQDTIERAADTIEVETSKFTVKVSSRGAGPVSIILKEYTLRDGTPIDMMPEAEGATPEASFAGGSFSTNELIFECDRMPGTYSATSSPLTLNYTYHNPTGGRIVRRLTFYPEEYHFDLVLTVENPGAMGLERRYHLVWGSPLGVTEPNADMDYDEMRAVAMLGDSRESLDDFDNNVLDQSLSGYTKWAGVRQKYFAAVMIPRSRPAEGVMARGVKEKIPWQDGTVEERRISVHMEMPFAAVDAVQDSFEVFVGPLDYDLMDSYDVKLEDMLDIGTMPVIGWLIKPFALGIIWLMPRLYDFVPNYGLVIILFALIIKIITLPLSMKSFKSMQAMRELQPQIEELRKRYKKDPQKLNAETMKLYKSSGVNPMSGCLPILPQMPLFVALFSVFQSTILLRDAPFFWFINDLSRGASGLTDPYILLVVLMVAMQFVSQSLTMPSTGQNKMMMYLMPLVFGFIFYRFPAGLVLYWTCFSVFSLLDWVLFKRDKSKNPQVKTV